MVNSEYSYKNPGTITPKLHTAFKREGQKRHKSLKKWWAHKDLNLGPRDYEEMFGWCQFVLDSSNIFILSIFLNGALSSQTLKSPF